MEFYIDITDAAGTKFGAGPIDSASRWRFTTLLDRSGDFSFTMPASDPKAALVQKTRVVQAYARLPHGGWASVGAGVIDNIQRRPQADGTVLIEVSGRDLLGELAYRSVRDLRLYLGGNPVSPATALAAVAPYAPPGWTFTPDPNPPVNSIYGRFNGESVLAALVKIAEKSQSHFWGGVDRRVTFASAFSDSGIRAVVPGPGELAPETCAITRLQETIESHSLVTRIYPRGSGNGDVQLTLKATTRTPPAGYVLNKANNYIESTVGIDRYGLRETTVEFREIGPVENTPADIRSAANMLFDEALRELQRRSQEAETPYYDLTLTGCSVLLHPMQKIRVTYRDTVAGLDIDRDLNILEATWEVDESGVQTTSVVVTAADRWPRGESGVVADALTQGRIYQALPQLNANEYVTSFTKNVDADETATFRFRFSKAVTALRWAFFEFQLLPFESTVKAVGGATSGSGQIPTGGPSVNTTGNPSNNVTGPASGSTGPATPAIGPATPTIGPATPEIGPATPTIGSATLTIGSATPTIGSTGLETGDPQGGDITSGGRHRHAFQVAGGSFESDWYPVYYDASEDRLRAQGLGYTALPEVIDNGYHTHEIDDHTHSIAPHDHTISDHTHTISDHTHTISDHTHTIASHTHTIASHTHTIASHTHDLGNHTHSLNNHTHDLSESIGAVYGIFRESSQHTYSIDELEYRVNSGAWSPLTDATPLGDGWHRLDITAAIQDTDTLLPLQESNRVEVRRLQDNVLQINGWNISSNTLNVFFTTLHGWSVGDRFTLSGAATGVNGTNVNGQVYTVRSIITGAIVAADYIGPNDNAPVQQGVAYRVKTATIDAQLSVHTTIQPIYQ